MEFSRLVVENGLSSAERVVLRLRGELDMAEAPDLRERLVRTAGTTDVLALDLAELAFIDSTGFLALHEAHAAARHAGTRLVLVSPSPTVSRVVALMGLDHLELSEDRSLLAGAAWVERGG